MSKHINELPEYLVNAAVEAGRRFDLTIDEASSCVKTAYRKMVAKDDEFLCDMELWSEIQYQVRELLDSKKGTTS